MPMRYIPTGYHSLFTSWYEMLLGDFLFQISRKSLFPGTIWRHPVLFLQLPHVLILADVNIQKFQFTLHENLCSSLLKEYARNIKLEVKIVSFSVIKPDKVIWMKLCMKRSWSLTKNWLHQKVEIILNVIHFTVMRMIKKAQGKRIWYPIFFLKQ